MKLIISIALALAFFTSVSQTQTEIYLFSLEKDLEGSYSITAPINISENEGYDNQPSFWPDGKSILYARTVDGQTEIARYFVGSGKTTRITHTLQESEYSPTPTPDGNISSIRLDTTGLQLLYRYDLQGNPEILIEDMKIGYHTWVGSDGIASFVLGEPNTLQYINLKSKKAQTLATDIGRSLHPIPGTKQFSYVDKSTDAWIIKSIHPRNRKTQDITRVKDGAEDYCWTPDKALLMGQGSVLWVWQGQVGWRTIADLNRYGLKNITRLALSPDGTLLAVVVEQ